MKTLNELATEAHKEAKRKGWHRETDGIIASAGDNAHIAAAMIDSARIALIHSELSEALEALRKNRRADLFFVENPSDMTDDEFKERFEMYVKDTVEDEIADVLIRTLEFAATRGMDIQRHVEMKMKYNALRPYKHGGKRF